MSDPLVQISGIYKSYGSAVSALEVLKGITLAIAKNELLALQGPSGAGKSTLLHIIGGLDQPDKGTVSFAGRDVYKYNPDQRAQLRGENIGFVFQFYHLLPEFNALENVLVPALLRSWWKGKGRRDYARALLEKVGLSARITHKPAELSGGEQQRVAIARALVNRPKLLLCDEPTGNLDSDNGAKILELLQELRAEAEMSVVIATHDNDIARAADRIIRLKDGVMLGEAHKELKAQS